jgi:hypothetical protein
MNDMMEKKEELEIVQPQQRREPAVSLGADATLDATHPSAVDVDDEENPDSLEGFPEENIVDIADSEDESVCDEMPSVADTATEFSVPAEGFLPVATRVNLEELRRQQQPQYDPNIPHAVPHDEELEKKNQEAAARRRFWCAATWLLAAVVAGVVVGVTMRSSSSDGAPPEPTQSPTSQVFGSLKELVTKVSFDEGAALENSESPQYRSLTWLEDNALLDEYPEWKKIQRYALGVFYYGTNGDGWSENSGWLSDEDECSW